MSNKSYIDILAQLGFKPWSDGGFAIEEPRSQPFGYHTLAVYLPNRGKPGRVERWFTSRAVNTQSQQWSGVFTDKLGMLLLFRQNNGYAFPHVFKDKLKELVANAQLDVFSVGECSRDVINRLVSSMMNASEGGLGGHYARALLKQDRRLLSLGESRSSRPEVLWLMDHGFISDQINYEFTEYRLKIKDAGEDGFTYMRIAYAPDGSVHGGISSTKGFRFSSWMEFLEKLQNMDVKPELKAAAKVELKREQDRLLSLS